MPALSAFHREKSTSHGFSSYPTAWWPCFATAITYHTHGRRMRCSYRCYIEGLKQCGLPPTAYHSPISTPKVNNLPFPTLQLWEHSLSLHCGCWHIWEAVSPKCRENKWQSPHKQGSPSSTKHQYHYSTNSPPHRIFRGVHVPVHMMFGAPFQKLTWNLNGQCFYHFLARKLWTKNVESSSKRRVRCSSPYCF